MAARIVDILVIIAVAAFLILSFAGDHPTGTQLREYVVEHGLAETGAANLVTSVYLGYRAFDTLGETIVLLLAVSGVLFLVERRH
jgi:multisubunit Na+/H+ antiporter MnhB subunit